MAEKRAKQAETSEHNTEYKATPSTPDNRAKPTAKTGPSPKKSPSKLPPVPPMPTGEKTSGSQDNPESTHGSKGKRGRPRNTQGPKPNTQGPPPVRKEIFKETPKAKAKANPIPTPKPKHDTDMINNNDFKFWEGQNLTIIKDQLNKLNYSKHRNLDGSRMNKPHYLAEILNMINAGSWIINDQLINE